MNNKTICIIDDDEGIIDAMRYLLEEKGFIVAAYTSCADIYEKIRKLDPGIILLDLWMPDVNGDEVTKKIKRDERLKHIPIVIVSANRTTEMIARSSGADDFLCKPFDIEELERMVAKFVQIS